MGIIAFNFICYYSGVSEQVADNIIERIVAVVSLAVGALTEQILKEVYKRGKNTGNALEYA